MYNLNLKINSNLFSLNTEFESEIHPEIFNEFMKDYWYSIILSAMYDDKETRIKKLLITINAFLNWESLLTDEAKSEVSVT